MSTIESSEADTETLSGIDRSDAVAAVEENRDLIERIADADVALSERCQTVLEAVDGGDETDG